MSKSDLQIFDSPSQQREKHIFHDILQYLLIIIITLSAIFTALLSFSDKFRTYF